MFASGSATSHQVSALEDANMFGYGIQRHVERVRELRDSRFTLRQALKNRPARRIRQGHQGLIKTSLGIHYIQPSG